MSEYVIQDSSGAFLGQNGVWVGEYPDACIFTDYSTAEKEYFYTLEIGSLTDPIELVENYGLETEESLFLMTSGEFREIGTPAYTAKFG